MTTVQVGHSDLAVLPLALGGNVFGWTADEATSLDVLDAFVDAGGSMVDTADGYSHWVPGHTGGESETIIGRWLARRGRRDDVVVATKVSRHPDFLGLAPDTIRGAVHASLQRLGTDHIDLYYAHFDDPSVPLADSLGALSALVDEGLVRYLGISNYTPDRIDEWLAVTERENLHRPVALQPEYNLVERGFEDGLQARAETYGLGVFPYYALASGFLTGKYRADGSPSGPRASRAAQYLEGRGAAVLPVLDEVAAAHGVSDATVALAWLRRRPTVVAPIASARSLDQLPDLLASTTLELAADEVAALDAASR
ncbi:aldo/keto reductase [Cellulomonas sp. T2.31MG-18]|uniref:aldo/keto reductase n=1 Tax=Cellulomonas sp. T2.31MG-18 TaxID=3157619 RepID=UPI00366FC964